MNSRTKLAQAHGVRSPAGPGPQITSREARGQEQLLDQFLAVNAHSPLYSTLEREYQRCYHQDTSFQDESLLVFRGEFPIAALVMSCDLSSQGERALTGFGRPILVATADEFTRTPDKRTWDLLRNHLDAVMLRERPTNLLFRDSAVEGFLSPLGRWLLDQGATCSPCFTQCIDLTQDEAQLRADIRKSYRSLINWGEKQLDLRILDQSNLHDQHLDDFAELHRLAAGRTTRPRSTWLAQADIVRSGAGFVILGYWDGDLVTAAFFNHNRFSCYYGVSASRRELFDKPMSHALIWRAILHARQLGCRIFELGEQYFPATSHFDQKLLGISKFKSGFGGIPRIQLNIRWTNTEGSSTRSTENCA